MSDTNSRARFWSLDPAVTFLNHGSFGACPIPVLEVQQQWRARMERQPVQFLARDLVGLLDEARSELASFIGADPDDLGWMPNATAGVNTVLRSLELRAQDDVLATDHAYAACRNALDFVTGRAGATVTVAAVPFPLDSPDRVVEAVLERVTPRTRFALLDHVTSPTGLVLPVERMVRALAERGVETLVDGAHAPGMLPLRLDALGAAWYVGNCHKWLCSPKGAAFLHARRDVQPGLRPLSISHGASSRRTDRSRFRLEFDWAGTDDPTAALCVPEAIGFMGSLFPGGWDDLREHNRALALGARRAICGALEIPPPCPDEMIGSLAAFPLPLRPETEGSIFGGDPLQEELLERHGIEVPVYSWAAPPRRLLRIAAQAYNDPEQYERLAEGVRSHISTSK